MNREADDPIRAFYNAHPYPPPVANLDRARALWSEPNRLRGDFHLFWPDRPYRADIDILVAGCGTFQAAKHAVCRPQARVTGIDVSATSLKETARLQRQYDLTNLTTELRGIEDVGDMQDRFDLIVCTGVLHHLFDPEAGLRALRAVLKPGGVIYLMVYAPYGRTGIYMLQDYCRRLGIGTSRREIAELVTAVQALPPQHPLMSVLGQSRDFENLDALADALLNPRDRAYDVPQLFEALAASGLSFNRWYRQAPYLPQCGAMAQTPHAAKIAALDPAAQYAAMELWRGAMATHSLIIRADDDTDHVPVQFEDGRWMNYVPIRLPSTACVAERLPPGAVGMLFNRNHWFHDLILPIGPAEKAMLDAIDGERTIGRIVEIAGGEAKDRARTFFEALWSYDQITVDASAARS